MKRKRPFKLQIIKKIAELRKLCDEKKSLLEVEIYDHFVELSFSELYEKISELNKTASLKILEEIKKLLNKNEFKSGV